MHLNRLINHPHTGPPLERFHTQLQLESYTSWHRFPSCSVSLQPSFAGQRLTHRLFLAVPVRRCFDDACSTTTTSELRADDKQRTTWPRGRFVHEHRLTPTILSPVAFPRHRHTLLPWATGRWEKFRKRMVMHGRWTCSLQNCRIESGNIS